MKNKELSKDLLEEMFPIGMVYPILYDFKKDKKEQIKNGLDKLNNIIGEWEYFGIIEPAIYFVRKK